MATRTIATSEDRDSMIRQRCGYKIPSSYAESCSAPSSRRHVEDVHSVGVAEARCTRHETCTCNQQKQPPPTQTSYSPTRATQHAKIRIMATRTVATSEDRDSEIRQRCGCKTCSSYAESCSAPSSRRHVEDVHSVGVVAVNCTRHETCTRNQQTNLRPLKHPIPQPKNNATRKDTKIIKATSPTATSEDHDSVIWQRCGCKT